MAVKEIIFGNGARKRLAAGADVLANAVKVTLGPKGNNVMLERSHSAPTLVKDGATVAREIDLADPLRNMGAQLLKEAASRTGEDAGDGTTTAIVLAQAIVREGLKYVSAGFSPIELKRGIDHAVAVVVEELALLAQPVATNREIAQVATVSANGDASIGDIIARAFEQAGNDGVITVEDGPSLQDDLMLSEGLQFKRGYLSPYFINDAERQLARLERPLILLSDQKISNVRELLRVLELAAQAARPLLIVAADVEGEALAGLVVNHARGLLKSVAVKAPGFGERRRESLEDLAALTGARVLSEDVGLTLANLTLADLGQARLVEAGKEHTLVIEGAGLAEEISARSAQIKTEIARASSPYDRDKLKERLAGLAGGVAIIRLGASTELELAEKKARLEDALHATRAAIDEGVVPGGGVALLRARQALARRPNGPLVTAGQDAGVAIVLRALEEPLRQIVINGGGQPEAVLNRVLEGTGNFGYNAADERYGDLANLGVLDPVKVTRSALQNAASVAGLLLLTDAGIYAVPLPPPAHDHHHDHDQQRREHQSEAA
jgi:chaperonin GroEL